MISAFPEVHYPALVHSGRRNIFSMIGRFFDSHWGKNAMIISCVLARTRTRRKMLVFIFVITVAGAEGTHPPCLISGLIFHFIAHLSISNNTNGSICMTGFVTWQIRCQPRLNITPEHYHNQPSNECGHWCEKLGWIREKGFSTLHSGG